MKLNGCLGFMKEGLKNAVFFYFDNNRARDNLLPIIKNNAFTPYNFIGNNTFPN